MARLTDLPPEVQAYYEGGKRVLIAGVPTRVAKHYGKTPGVDIIAAARDAGAGIEFLPDAPRFHFEPKAPALHIGPPSKRGTYGRKRKPTDLPASSWWSPARLSLDPMYSAPMKGDPPALTYARKRWAKGDPRPLREWLASQPPRRAAALDLKLAA